MDINEMRIIGSMIAESLTGIDPGSKWTIGPREFQHMIQIQNAAAAHETISIVPPADGKHKYKVSGHLPLINGIRPYTEGNPPGAIGVSAGKCAQEVARDIFRRLLPQHRQYLAAYCAAAQAEKSFQDGRIELAKALNRIMGSEWAPGPNFSMTEGTPVAKLQYPLGPLAPLASQLTATVQSETSIEIRLDVCTPEIATTLMSVIMTTLGQYAIDQEEAPTESIPDQSFRDAARAEYDSEIEIDSNAEVSRGDDDGAFVAAWLWVSNEAAEDARDNNNRDGRA